MISAYRVSERTLHLNPNKRNVEIIRMGQIKGPDKWAIKIDQNFALLKNGEIYWEPQPSSRSEEYLKQARYDTAEDAYSVYIQNQEKIHGAFEINEFGD